MPRQAANRNIDELGDDVELLQRDGIVGRRGAFARDWA